MKTQLSLILLLITLFFVNCTRKYEKTSYYDTGEIKERFLYPTKDDYNRNNNYNGYYYYKNGKVKIYTTIRNGKKEGVYITYYSNGSYKSLINFKKGKKHGINKYFTENGELVEEHFFLNGVQMTKMKSYNNKGGTINFYYYVEEDTVEENGRLVFDKQGNVVPENSFYYSIISEKDTLFFGENYNFEIKVFAFNEKCIIKEFLLGDFDEYYNFIDSTSVTALESNNNSIKYTYRTKNRGYNLLMGKVYVESSIILKGEKINLSREFIFYDDFYVLPSNASKSNLNE